MTFKVPFQLKLFCDSMGLFSRSIPLRAMPCIHTVGSGLAGFKPRGAAPKVQVSEHQWHRGALGGSWLLGNQVWRDL